MDSIPSPSLIRPPSGPTPSLSINVAFLPVSGTYVMTAEEAAEAAKKIMPKIAIPMHYGKIVGEKADALKFKEMCDFCRVEIMES